jgi:signal transduction histidine kinase
MEPYAAEREIQLVLTTGDPQLLAAPKANGGGPAINYQLSADGRALQQALVNLLDNAIKHSRSGQTVTIRLDAVISVPSSGFGSEKAAASIQSPASENPSHDTRHVTLVTLSVEDQGTGIPQAEHEKIFERFYRLGSELRRETQGVGIGLSIVKHIVEAHGGRIIVRSAPGQGSRFTIELPVQPPSENDE